MIETQVFSNDSLMFWKLLFCPLEIWEFDVLTVVLLCPMEMQLYSNLQQQALHTVVFVFVQIWIEITISGSSLASTVDTHTAVNDTRMDSVGMRWHWDDYRDVFRPISTLSVVTLRHAGLL